MSKTTLCIKCQQPILNDEDGRPRTHCFTCRPRTYTLQKKRTLDCINCGKAFTTSHPKKLYCSRMCGNAARMAARTPKTRTDNPRGTCTREECDRPHHAKGLCNRHYAQSIYVPKVRTDQTCQQCGSTYSPTGRRQHYCSPQCQRRALVDHGPKQCSIPGCTRGHRARGLCQAHLKREYRKQGMITPEPWGDRRKARDQERRARKAGATIGPTFTPTQVFDRDQWKCQLCGEHVDSTLQWPDPKSASLDHRIPLAKGGEHSLANTQLAHLDCNVSKGSRLAA